MRFIEWMNFPFAHDVSYTRENVHDKIILYD